MLLLSLFSGSVIVVVVEILFVGFFRLRFLVDFSVLNNIISFTPRLRDLVCIKCYILCTIYVHSKFYGYDVSAIVLKVAHTEFLL